MVSIAYSQILIVPVSFEGGNSLDTPSVRYLSDYLKVAGTNSLECTVHATEENKKTCFS